jgi:hypothetical protein
MAICKDHGGQYNIDCPSCIAARRPRRPEWLLKVSDCFVIVAVLLSVVLVILAVGSGEFVRGSLSILDLFLWLLRHARQIRAPGPSSNVCNSPEFWDDRVITSSSNLTRLRNGATNLRNRPEFQRSQLTELGNTDFESWAKESFEIATKIAYRNDGRIGIPRVGI